MATNTQGVTVSRSLPMGPANVQAINNKYEVDNFTVNVMSGKQVQVDVQMRKKGK